MRLSSSFWRPLAVMSAAVLAGGVLLFPGVTSPPPAYAAPFTVKTTADSGADSLRQAILDANADPDTDTIAFDIPAGSDPGECNAETGVCTITPASALPSITQPAIIDGYTQPGSSPNTNPPGSGSNAVLKIELDGTNAGSVVAGLNITGGGSTVRGLVVNRFDEDGIEAGYSGGNTIEGNFIGTDVSGTVDLGNSLHGVSVFSSPNNTIGGTTPAARNVISGNGEKGVLIEWAGAHGNVVQGNLIGTDASGTVDLGNSGEGVWVFDAPGNTIGGTTEAARNVISGNSYGVYIRWAGATGNVVQGNYIGTDVDGTAELGNSKDGVYIDDSSSNTIGGTTAGERNVISGNDKNGIMITGSGSTGNQVQGNLIGTDVTGSADLGNGTYGVTIRSGASNNTIGGTTGTTPGGSCTGACNVISGNDNSGVQIYTSTSTLNVVAGNYIGTDLTGTADLGNINGVEISGTPGNTVGGTTPEARNVISGNSYGVFISGSSATGNVVQGNYIGTKANGSEALGNSMRGVYVTNQAANNTIGGTTAGARNVISGNGYDGIEILSGASGNQVQGNYIGTKANGSEALGNSMRGVYVYKAANNTIGGTTAGARNVISANLHGVAIGGDLATGNQVVGNYIGTDVSGTQDLGNTSCGVQISGASGNSIGGTSYDARNVISGNQLHGIEISSGASGNQVQGNYIGTDVDGTAELGNSNDGVYIDDSSSNTIGGTTAGERNVISGNNGIGILMQGIGATGNLVQGNYIGTDWTGTAALGNGNRGVLIFGSSPSNTIGGTTSSERNLISGNGDAGVEINGGGTVGNIVKGNYIGTDVTGNSLLGNLRGVIISGGAVGNTVGGPYAGEGNLVSGSSDVGVDLWGSDTRLNQVLGNVINRNRLGIVIGGGAGETMIQGNYIGTDSAGAVALPNTAGGISITGSSGNGIGGPTPAERNVISGNGSWGVTIQVDGSTGNIVYNNHIGVGANAGTPLGNAAGGVLIYDSADGNTVQSNVIGANGYGGVAVSRTLLYHLSGSSTDPFAFIALNGTLEVLVNGSPVVVAEATGWTPSVGFGANPGDTLEVRASAAGSGSIGALWLHHPGTGEKVQVTAGASGGPGEFFNYGPTAISIPSTPPAPPSGNVVMDNYVGTDATGILDLGNSTYGVGIDGSTDTTITNNTIAFNVGLGVAMIGASSENQVTHNRIYENSSLGIDLGADGVTFNDPLDGDSGANNLQNFPILTSATGGSTHIQGTFNSTPDTHFTLEFFYSSSCDPSGNGEGESFLGSTEVDTNGSGNAPIDVIFPDTVSLGQFITATATDPSGNTSEFSACIQVSGAPTPTPTPGAPGQASAADWCSGGVCQEWLARYDGPASGDDEAYALAVDGSGNVYVTGMSPGSGTGPDYATVKYNGSGEQDWLARYDGPSSGYDAAQALAVDGSGNVYVTGASMGSGTGSDYATVKYNASGEEQWVARYDGPANFDDIAYGLAVDGSGNVYVTGFSSSGTGYDYATVKYNASGEEQWVARYNGPASNIDEAHALVVDGSGNVYVTGWSWGSGASIDYATVKYDAGGEEQWVRRYDGPGAGADSAFALAVDGSGNVCVTGASMGSGTYDDYATVKYDPDGVQQWVARYDGPVSGFDTARALAVDGTGNVYVTGSSRGYGAYDDYATVKYDPDGVPQWEARYDGPESQGDYAVAVVVDGSGNVYVTGFSSSGTGYDYATVRYDAGGVEQWVARYDGPATGADWSRALAVDGSGNVYVTGTSIGSRPFYDFATVKYYTPVMDRLAGDYKDPGWDPTDDGHAALEAQLDDPHGLYETGTGSTLYFADTGNDRIRVVNTEAQDIVVAGVTIHPGDIDTVAGGGAGCTEPCSATDQSLNEPHDVFVDGSGNIFIADTDNNRIRKVNTGGSITTVAGGGAGCTEPCQATQQSLSSPSGVAVDEAGNIYIADTENNRIRKVGGSTGNITTVVGTGEAGYAGDGGLATAASLNRPHDVYPYGSMYAGTTDLLIADTANNVIRWVHGPSGIINTLAGNGDEGFSGDDGPAIEAELKAPEAVASDASLAVFVADTQNDRIRRFAFGEAVITTFAGGGSGCEANHTEPYYGCPATDAKLNHPKGVATGSVPYSDSGSATLGEIDPYTGEPVESFSNAAGCTNGMATIDWAFLVVALGLILARSRVGGLLMRIQMGAGLSRGPKTKRRD